MPRCCAGTRCDIPELGLGSGIKKNPSCGEKIHDVCALRRRSRTQRDESLSLLIVGMHANHQRRKMVEGEQAREQKS
jgi:hypothetical protein